MVKIRYLVIRVSLMAAVTVKMNLNSKNFNNSIKIIILLHQQRILNLPLGNHLKINNILNKETAHSQTKVI